MWKAGEREKDREIQRETHTQRNRQRDTYRETETERISYEIRRQLWTRQGRTLPLPVVEAEEEEPEFGEGVFGQRMEELFFFFFAAPMAYGSS